MVYENTDINMHDCEGEVYMTKLNTSADKSCEFVGVHMSYLSCL